MRCAKRSAIQRSLVSSREFGLRMALGASSGSVTRMVLREALTITAIGIGVGLPVGVAAARFIRRQLFGVSAVNPASLSIAVAMLVLTTLLASWGPRGERRRRPRSTH